MGHKFNYLAIKVSTPPSAPSVSNIWSRIFWKLEKLRTKKKCDFGKLEKLVTENLAREARQKKIALFSCFTRENGDFGCPKRVSDNGSKFLENMKS